MTGIIDENQDTVMSLNFGLTDYGRLRYMLEMADLLKDKRRIEKEQTETPKNPKLEAKVEKLQKSVDDVLKKMEDYAKKHKSKGVVAFA